VFSLKFLLSSLTGLIQYPSVVLDIARGKNPSVALYSRRIKKWNKIRGGFESRPGQVFGLQIYLNSEDMSRISSSIATSGRYDLAQTEIVRKFVKPGMTFVDIGANIGYFTLLASKLVGPRGLVVAYEPENLNYSLLSKSITANNLKNVRAIQEGVYDRTGRLSLFLADPTNPEAHSLTQRHSTGRQEIRTTTLDELYRTLNKRKLDFIKIHVGAEPQILRGAEEVLGSANPIIMMTFAQKLWDDERELLAKLFSRFSVFRVVESPFLIRNIQMNQLTQLNHANLLLIPSS